MNSLSRGLHTLLMVGIAGAAQLALAADVATYSIDIPAQDLRTALLKFATATHQQIAFDQALVEGYQSTPLAGTYAVPDGLRMLMGGAPFHIGTTPAGVLTITATDAAVGGTAGTTRAVAQPASMLASATLPGELSASTSRFLPEVIVKGQRKAQRAELAPKVSAFVTGVAAFGSDGGSENFGGGIPRWRTRVCPLVAGLNQQEGEFILERVSEIARAAGVPLADESCRPNLFILVSNQPSELLQAMERRDYAVTFGDAPPFRVDEFIATPRAVRVWYTFPTVVSFSGGSGGGSAAGHDLASPTTVIQSPTANTLSADSGFMVAPGGGATEDGSTFSRVQVIVDVNRLNGVTWGQLTDYVAMVGLAKIKATAHLGDAPTILRLFAGAPEAAPAGLSDWDRAFLKSLYGFESQPFVQPRSALARRMVREMVP